MLYPVCYLILYYLFFLLTRKYGWNWWGLTLPCINFMIMLCKKINRFYVKVTRCNTCYHHHDYHSCNRYAPMINKIKGSIILCSYRVFFKLLFELSYINTQMHITYTFIVTSTSVTVKTRVIFPFEFFIILKSIKYFIFF